MTRPEAIALARQMYGDGDAWGITDIQRHLNKRGVQCSRTTVRRWVDPEFEKRRRHDQREYMRAKRLALAPAPGRLGRADHSREFRHARMRALSDLGITEELIARLMSFDYSEDVTVGKVREATRGPRKRGSWHSECVALIREDPSLTDAELARRFGVNRMTVAYVRARKAAA